MPLNRNQILVVITATGLVLMASSHRWTTGALAQAGPLVFDPHLAVRTVASGLTQPTSMAFLGANDFLVVEKPTGQVKHIVNGVLTGIALDLAVNSNSECGLLGIALHPGFGSNHFIYLYWTCTAPRPVDPGAMRCMRGRST